MRSIVVDSGPLIALFDRDDAYYARARNFLRRNAGAHFITTPLVVGEVAALVCDDQPELFRFLKWVAESVEIDESVREDLPRMIEIMKKYSDLPSDIADASLVALCERRGLDIIASIDSDFDVYRLPKGRKFKNVFRSEDA